MPEEYNYLANFINALQSQGRYTFSFEELEEKYNQGSDALRKALRRLIQKERIVRIRDKFYVIVPPEYAHQGILPASLFIHDLMEYLGKFYYVGLLSSAALQGAAHQQPQVFQVMTLKPTRRPIKVKDLDIQFYFKSIRPEFGVIQHKTDTGYIQISNPALTVMDLVMYENRIGGLQRILSVFEELSDGLNADQIREVIRNPIPVSVLQRVGYLCDRIFEFNSFADCIHERIRKKPIYRTLLDPSSGKAGSRVDPRWKVVLNMDLESGL